MSTYVHNYNLQQSVWLSGCVTNEMVSRVHEWLEIASNWKRDRSLSTCNPLSLLAELAEYLENLNTELDHSVS